MERTEIEAAAARFKSEVDASMAFFFYPEFPTAETVTDVLVHDWGFSYQFDGLPCAVRVAGDGTWEDYSDVGVDERGDLDTFGQGFVRQPTLDALVAGLIANQADSIDDYDITVEQRAERDRLHSLDEGTFVP